MKWFDNLALKKKFFVLISLPLVSVVVSLIIVYTQFTSLQNEFEQMAVNEFSLHNKINDLYAQGLQTEQATRNILLNPLDQKAAKNYADAHEKFLASIEEAEKLTRIDANKTELNELKKMWNELHAAKLNIQSLARNNQFETAKIKLNDEVTPKWREVKEKIFKIRDSELSYFDNYRAETMSGIDRSKLMTILLGFVVGVFSFGFIFFGDKNIIAPIKNLQGTISNIANGDYNIDCKVHTKDEFGELAQNIVKMSEVILQQISYLTNLPSPFMAIDKDFNIIEINKHAAAIGNKKPEQLIGTKCYDHFKTTHCKTENCACFKAMRDSKITHAETLASPLGTEIPVSYVGTPLFDKSGRIYGALESVTDLTATKEYEKYLDENVKFLLREMEKFASGDLTVHLTSNTNNDDIISKLFAGFNISVKKFRDMLNKLSEVVHSTASASAEISSSAEEMAAGAQEQSSQTTEIAGAIEQMTKTILETSKNAGVASDKSKYSGEAAKSGGKSISETVSGMNKIANVVEKASETIKQLGASSEKIGSIIEVIDDIADQTNLLALNAAIEAARAGEHGRGFAVVADEVRKLAERTTKATKEIGSMIKGIQHDTNEAVSAMENGTMEVKNGLALANESGESLKKIIESTDEVLDVINQVAAASEELSSAADQISHSIEGINSVTQQSAAGVQEIAHAAEDLNNLTVKLQNLIEQFKFEDEAIGFRNLAAPHSKNWIRNN